MVFIGMLSWYYDSAATFFERGCDGRGGDGGSGGKVAHFFPMAADMLQYPDLAKVGGEISSFFVALSVLWEDVI